MKWDGVRAVAYLAAGGPDVRRALSRKGRDEHGGLPRRRRAARPARRRVGVLDGEIVVTDAAGRPDFGLLQTADQPDPTRRHRARAAQTLAGAADGLRRRSSSDGSSLRRRPYAERRDDPRRCSARPAGPRVHVPPVFDGDLDGRDRHQPRAPARGRGGQATDSVYQPGRRGSTWLKIKNLLTQEVVVGGWRPGQGGATAAFGSLLMGIPGPDGLRYVGRVGSGFSDRRSTRSTPWLDSWPGRPARWSTSRPRTRADAHWVRPELVGEVAYAELTRPGRCGTRSGAGCGPTRRRRGGLGTPLTPDVSASQLATAISPADSSEVRGRCRSRRCARRAAVCSPRGAAGGAGR